MLKRISVTSVSEFLECKRRWRLKHVERLEAKVPPTALFFGSAIHEGLSAYYQRQIDHPRARRTASAALVAFRKYVHKSFEEMAEEYGGWWELALPEFEALIPLGEGMLSNYVDYDVAQTQNWTPTEVETLAVIPTETGVDISMKLDLLCDSPIGEVVVDHKTFTRQPSYGTALDLDFQLTGYAWGRQRKTGKIPAWLVYNGLMKRLPEPPALLKSGIFSRDKKQLTTAVLYRRTIEAAGHKIEAYRDVLAALEQRGWSDFFVRVATQRNEAQIRSWERHVFNTLVDMQEVAEEPELAYPNPSQMRCPGCPFLEMCLAMEDGGDTEAVIEAKFYRRPQRKEA
jgi:CRISPR/Cas system-associated exonuclease Cas4 (RecB family)